VIDGATNSIVTVTDPNANGLTAVAIAVNPVTNKIYVANRVSDFTAGANNTVVQRFDLSQQWIQGFPQKESRFLP
jgi:DNA-binding beta-propeller fold protein YncE